MSCNFTPSSKKYGAMAVISFVGILFTFMGSALSIVGTCMVIFSNSMSMAMLGKELCGKPATAPAEPV